MHLVCWLHPSSAVNLPGLSVATNSGAGVNGSLSEVNVLSLSTSHDDARIACTADSSAMPKVRASERVPKRSRPATNLSKPLFDAKGRMKGVAYEEI